MSLISTAVRRGAYHDSVVLMLLQRRLAALPGILDVGVVMATPANREILAASQLLSAEAATAAADDLVIAVRARDSSAATAALAAVDDLLAEKPAAGSESDDPRPRSLAQARKLLPQARWALISVPGRFAAGVARDALENGLNVFLYSDNVALADEVALKNRARELNLLVMGPDCGTAAIGGIGFGFANRVRRGAIGLIGASGTGLQLVSTAIDARGSGISQMIGTGSHDLAAEVGGATTLAALDRLAADPSTLVIVLISKPPAPAVAAQVLARARACRQPIVVYFQGAAMPIERLGDLFFARSLDHAAVLAVELAKNFAGAASSPVNGFVRGLFGGGTLAQEVALALRAILAPLHGNFGDLTPLPSLERSQGHTLLDLGADELTVGRLHPMIDSTLRQRRLRQESADREVGVIVLDLVLGQVAEAEPAAAFAPLCAEAKRLALDQGRALEILILLVGSAADSQDRDRQADLLASAGALVFDSVAALVEAIVAFLPPAEASSAPNGLVDLENVAALNVGLALFEESLHAQGAPCLGLDWRPPAGGNERLAGILDRLRGEKT